MSARVRVESRDKRREVRFGAAARAYRFYGIVYLIGGLWLVSQGVGVRGGPAAAPWRDMAAWGSIGLFFLLVIPYLVTTRRRWMGLIGRRHIAMLVALLLAVRAWKVGHVVLGPPRTVAAPWGGEISYAVGAAIFLVITVVALAAMARAAWTRDP